MRNSASALALQLCLDFDQPIKPVPEPPTTSVVPTDLFDVTAKPPAALPVDFSFAGGRVLAPSWKGRAHDNIEAIRLLNLPYGETWTRWTEAIMRSIWRRLSSSFRGRRGSWLKRLAWRYSGI